MDLKIKISHEFDSTTWDDNLKKSFSASAFQTSKWAEVYKNTFNSIPVFVVAESENEIKGQLLAIIHKDYNISNDNPIFNKVIDKLNLGLSISWKYGPIIFDENNFTNICEKMILAVEEVARKNHVSIIRGTEPANSIFSLNDIFHKNGYEQKKWGTFLIDLKQEPETIFNQLNKKTRYDIRKAEKNCLTFEVANDEQSFKEFLLMKHKLKLSPKYEQSISKYVKSHIDSLQKNNYEKLFVVKHNGKILGGIRNSMFNGYVIQHGVANSEEKRLQGGSFLTWNTIKWCSENNFDVYDMGGINPLPNSDKENDISFYKSKWGGKKILYNVFTKKLDSNRYYLTTIVNDPKRSFKRLIKLKKNHKK